MIHKVIYSLYPNATYINEDSQAFDAQGNLIELNMVAVNAEVAKLQAEVRTNAYKKQRLNEYPSIGDQLDALWKGGDDAAAMLALVQAVKAKYPKGTE